MATPDELEASHKRYLWKVVYQLDILHSELQSLYLSKTRDQKRIDVIWHTIDELEIRLLVEGVDYESYVQERQRALGFTG